MENDDWSPVVAEQQRAKDRATIDSLVAALVAARDAIPGDDYFKVRPKIDAALALARKGG